MDLAANPAQINKNKGLIVKILTIKDLFCIGFQIVFRSEANSGLTTVFIVASASSVFCVRCGLWWPGGVARRSTNYLHIRLCGFAHHWLCAVSATAGIDGNLA